MSTSPAGREVPMVTLIVMELVYVVAVATLFAADMMQKGWPYVDY